MHLRFLSRSRLFEPDNGGNPAGGQGQGQGALDQTQSLQNLLARNNNDAMAMAAQLFNENYQLRERNRQLQSQAPAEGSLLLTREQAQAWQAYTQLGAPAELSTQLTQAQGATQQLATLQRQEQTRGAAEVAGYKASVLSRLPGADALTFEVREVAGVDGKAARQAFVRPKEGDAVALSAYAAQHWADFLPALQASAPAPAPAPGVPYPGQQPSTGAPPADPVAAFMARAQAQRDAAPSPLAPKKPAA